MLTNIINIVIIVVSVMLIVLVLDRFSTVYQNETMVNIKPIDGDVKWKRSPQCGYKMGETLKKTLEKYGMKETDGGDWNLHIPCTYNDSHKEVKDADPKSEDQRIFIVNNADELTSKNHIWKNLVKQFGREEAKKIMPVTYVLTSPEDVVMFESEYDPNKIYIMKKNIQRQEGLKITRDIDQIRKGSKEGYVVVQELLQNPYTISDRKINLRCYLLLVCQNNDISAYVHKDGFMYYTKVPFVKNSVHSDPNITTGYIDRQVYIDNPLTHDDFRVYLDNYKNHPLTQSEVNIIRGGGKISKDVFNKIFRLLSKVVYAVKDTVCVDSHLKTSVTFQLFGVDVAINDELEPQLMEVNKGPDMGSKDEKDGNIKSGVMTDIFKVIKMIPERNHDFIKIYDDTKSGSASIF
jgi:hypothetical protein